VVKFTDTRWVPSSNSSWKNGYLELRFYGLLQFLQTKIAIISYLKKGVLLLHTWFHRSPYQLKPAVVDSAYRNKIISQYMYEL